MLNKRKGVHFIGVGGIGMSGIAYILASMGYKVSGSDLELNDLTRKISSEGGKIFKGHRKSNLPHHTGAVVYSSSVSDGNPEIAEATKKRIPILHRSEVLAELFNSKNGIAVTGTHGKTTTTSLIAVMLYKTGLDPTAIIGGEVKEFGGNAHLGSGEHVVAEADESDSSFLNLKPFYSVITNVEMEHLDHFKSMADIKAAYRAFADNTKPGGTLFYCADDENLKSAIKGYKGKKESYGFAQSADMRAIDVRMDMSRTEFGCVYEGKFLGNVSINIPGRHNVLNALAAILVGLSLGIAFDRIKSAIRDFGGAKRRFHIRADAGGVMLIDDYAHHPTEIRAVLDACRNWKGKRLIVIFQPHRFTRTQAMSEEFGKCFGNADIVILTDIYAASEKAIPGVSIKNIYDAVKRYCRADVSVVGKGNIAKHVLKIVRPGDMVVVMGAGDIKKVADELTEKIGDRSGRKVTLPALGGILGSIKGRVKFNEPLSSHTSFKIGGSCDLWVEPKDTAELKKVLARVSAGGKPSFIIGNGTNLLVNDEGFSGIVISLNSPFFKKVEFKGERVRVGAGYSLPKLVMECSARGLSGLESLIGIPGTIGGAVFMNAGGWSSPIYKNIGDLVTSLKVLDPTGKVIDLKKKDMSFGYRKSGLDGYIILSAEFQLGREDKKAVLARCGQFLKIKREKQVLDRPSAGCIFKNPAGFQFTCGQMIDMLGLKGAMYGGAKVSKKHANFIINAKDAKCADVLNLIDIIKRKVHDNYGLDLEMEVKVI